MQVLPSDIGQRQPLYFFLLPAYWKPNQAIKGSASTEDAPDSPLMGSTGTNSYTNSYTNSPQVELGVHYIEPPLLLCQVAPSSVAMTS